MAVLTYSEIETLMLDRAVASASTGAPLSTAEKNRFVDQAYLDVYEISGGGIKRAADATAWDGASQLATGTLQGLLTDIREIRHVFASTVAPFTVVCATTSGQKTVTSSAGFGAVVAGMQVSGTGIAAGTTVAYVTSTSSLTLSANATATNDPVTLTFTPTGNPGTDVELTQRTLPYINWLRSSAGHGPYTTPKVYAITRLDTSTAGDVGKVQMDYFPGKTGFYFPVHYIPTLVPLAGSANAKPNVTDLESSDIGLIAAARLALSVDRRDLLDGILADVSQRTAKALAQKFKAMMSGDPGR